MTDLKSIYEILLKEFGTQKWWPIKNGFSLNKNLSEEEMLEICVGAILTQNTAWKNVEKAIEQMHLHKAMGVKKLQEIEEKKLGEMIRSAGFYNQKAERVKLFVHQLKKYRNKLANRFDKKSEELRLELLSLNGVGNETADSMILYAAKKPVFVIDAYTKRIFSRLGFCPEDTQYSELQEIFHKNLKKDEKMFNEYHALLVELAKKNCRKKPECKTCCLKKKCRYYLSRRSSSL